jgi:hypothetical protein
MNQEIEIKGIFIAAGHGFYWQQPGAPADYPMQSLDQVRCMAGKGLEGDRFFGFKENFKGQVTFFSQEVLDSVQAHVGAECPPWATRRNILVTGVDLNRLIGRDFRIGEVGFEGTEECAPCEWMDHAIGEGARDFLRGRGGLRARITRSGILRAGARERLSTAVDE